jgi:hypothetical protein
MLADACWFDEAAGPLVRPYTVTGGRTKPGRHELELISLVVALPSTSGRLAAGLGPEHHRILVLCAQPTSVAEISAEMRLPVSVVKIIIGDLLDRELVATRSAAQPNVQLLQAVINGLRRL